MKIMILNGSPHMKGHTMAMVDAFMDGAKESGHEVILHHVALMNIKGCLGCECCHQKEDAQCVQKDDMQLLSHDLQTADMIRVCVPCLLFYSQCTAAKCYSADICIWHFKERQKNGTDHEFRQPVCIWTGSCSVLSKHCGILAL